MSKHKKQKRDEVIVRLSREGHIKVSLNGVEHYVYTEDAVRDAEDRAFAAEQQLINLRSEHISLQTRAALLVDVVDKQDSGKEAQIVGDGWVKITDEAYSHYRDLEDSVEDGKLIDPNTYSSPLIGALTVARDAARAAHEEAQQQITRQQGVIGQKAVEIGELKTKVEDLEMDKNDLKESNNRLEDRVEHYMAEAQRLRAALASANRYLDEPRLRQAESKDATEEDSKEPIQDILARLKGDPYIKIGLDQLGRLLR